jgi:hypothetical protein
MFKKNEKVIINIKGVKLWECVVMAYFNVPNQHLPERTEENAE